MTRPFNTLFYVWIISSTFSLFLESLMVRAPAVWVAHIQVDILLFYPTLAPSHLGILDYVSRKIHDLPSAQDCPSCPKLVQGSLQKTLIQKALCMPEGGIFTENAAFLLLFILLKGASPYVLYLLKFTCKRLEDSLNKLRFMENI